MRGHEGKKEEVDGKFIYYDMMRCMDVNAARVPI